MCPSVRAQDEAFLDDEDIDTAGHEQLDELQDVLTDHEYDEQDKNIPDCQEEYLDICDDIEFDNNELDYQCATNQDETEIFFLDEGNGECSFDEECWLFHTDSPDNID